MSFFEELTKKATGLLADIKGTTDDGSASANLQNMFQNTDTRQYGQRQKPISSSPLDVTKFGYTGIDRMARGTDTSEKLKNQLSMSTMPKARDEAKTNPLGITNDQSKQFFGMDLNQIKTSWKDKGGFEGLMSNPGFTLGLAIMSSSAQGRPISESLLNNVLASGEISSAYADRIKARSKVLGPVSEDQREEVRSVLAESDIFKGSPGQKFKNFFKGKNTEALNRRALDDIYDTAYKIAQKKASPGKEVRVDRNTIEEAVRKLEKEKKLDISEKGRMSFFFGRGVQSTAPGLAKGGPAEAGKEYIVGEEGPEMFVPEVDGNVIKNDDAKVVNMLLEHNPQLKNISRARAVKILKNRFPDYF